MADRPIIFSGPMVRALIEGRKTQTRRVLKPPYGTLEYLPDRTWKPICTKFCPGDRLYVREAHSILPRAAYRMSIGTGTIAQAEHPTDGYTAAVFREGFDRSRPPRWRPSIHMPRWASRLTLTVTDVSVQRLQDISDDDAQAEGMAPLMNPEPVEAFCALWRSLHGPDAWDANPWVVALTFTVEQRNIDAGVNHG